MEIKLPDDVKYIIDKLTENGYEAYAVGGCVRDSIIHRVPGDWDITTSATPIQVKSVFRRTIDTGIQHGTVTVMLGKNGYEVTTYRIDGEYIDGRHPENVEFTSSLEEDLKRRDFTINAMAYNDNSGMVDKFGGQKDLEEKIIRCVGNPKERFSEDALRMLRAVRFSAQLGFEIHEDTAQAIKELVQDIEKVSKERINTELGKILVSPNPEFIKKAWEYGITQLVFKAFDELEDKDTPLKLIKKLPLILGFRYAALLYGVGAAKATAMLKELKLDNNTIDTCRNLIELHNMTPLTQAAQIRHLASQKGPQKLLDALLFESAYYQVTGDSEKEEKITLERKLLKSFIKDNVCLTQKQLAVTGRDLIDAGVEPGKKMGELLLECLNMVLDKPEKNNRADLMEYVRTKI